MLKPLLISGTGLLMAVTGVFHIPQQGETARRVTSAGSHRVRVDAEFAQLFGQLSRTLFGGISLCLRPPLLVPASAPCSLASAFARSASSAALGFSSGRFRSVSFLNEFRG